MPRLRRSLALLLCLACWPAAAALADTVRIENGDRLTGKVVRLEGGTLTLETAYSEPIRIDRARVVGIETEAAVELHLEGGERLRGRLVDAGDGLLAVGASGAREEVPVRWEQVAAINPKPVEPPKIKGHLAVGATAQSGNTDRNSASVGLEATRRDERHRFSLSFLHNYAEEEGEVTTRNTFGAFKYDYFLTEKAYAYLGVELLKDKFKDLNLRTVVGPGLGYQFWDEEKTALALEAGVAYFSEDRDEGEDDQWITGRLAGNFRYRLLDKVDFTEKLVVYPSLEDAGHYTLRNEAALATPIAFGWALRLSSIIDHDSDPDSEDVKKTDYQWILGLQYDF